MLNSWIPQGTINWLEKNLMVIIDKEGNGAKGYGRAKDLIRKQKQEGGKNG